MSYLKVIKKGLYTSIQDAGRYGYAQYGIPQSGAMDSYSAKLAHKLVNNNQESALIECTYIPPVIEFHKNYIISLTGADMRWHINDFTVPRFTSLYVRKGSILKGSSAADGVRAYIAVQGELDVDMVLGSKSYYSGMSLGGFQGRLLEQGDQIKILGKRSKWSFKYIADEERPDLKSEKLIPITRGPEWHYLDQDAKASFISSKWTISSQSDRMAALLLGHKINLKIDLNMPSVPVFPGIIQTPPNENPIVVLNDGQTSGGYPRAAIIPANSLSVFNQIRPLEPFRFFFVN